jgi:uncharacterized protein with HEPN domain
MMPGRDRQSLQDMLDNARRVLALVADRSRPEFEADWIAGLALIRLFEVIGEAATRVSPETRTHSPGIPWRSIIGMRNRLIHGYDVVDPDAVWRAVQEDLPPLIAALERALAAQKGCE